MIDDKIAQPRFNVMIDFRIKLTILCPESVKKIEAFLGR